MIYVIIVYAQSLSKRISLYKGSRNTTAHDVEHTIHMGSDDYDYDDDGLIISSIAKGNKLSVTVSGRQNGSWAQGQR